MTTSAVNSDTSNTNKEGRKRPTIKGRNYKNSGAGGGKKPKITKEERKKKYTDIAKKRRDKQNEIRGGSGGKNNRSVCFKCRQPGHVALDCPSIGGDGNNDNNNIAKDGLLCYKCGSTEHALHHCPKRHRGDRNDLPYATCFVCSEMGHLASSCRKTKVGYILMVVGVVLVDHNNI